MYAPPQIAASACNPDNGKPVCLGAPGSDYAPPQIPDTPAITFSEEFIYSRTHDNGEPMFCRVGEEKEYYLWEILDEFFREQWNRFCGVTP